MGKCFICDLEVHFDIHSCRFCPLLHFLCNKVSYRGWNANLSDMEDFLSCYVTSCLPDFGSWSLLGSNHNVDWSLPAFPTIHSVCVGWIQQWSHHHTCLAIPSSLHIRGWAPIVYMAKVSSWVVPSLTAYIHDLRTYVQPERVVVCRCYLRWGGKGWSNTLLECNARRCVCSVYWMYWWHQQKSLLRCPIQHNNIAVYHGMDVASQPASWPVHS